MPEEILAVMIITILSFTTMMIVGMTLRYKSKKAEGHISSGSSSLTTSELERMMKRAVKDATAPLHEKIDRLEEVIVTTGSREMLELGEAPTDLLHDMDLHQTEEELPKRQARSRT